MLAQNSLHSSQLYEQAKGPAAHRSSRSNDPKECLSPSLPVLLEIFVYRPCLQKADNRIRGNETRVGTTRFTYAPTYTHTCSHAFTGVGFTSSGRRCAANECLYFLFYSLRELGNSQLAKSRAGLARAVYCSATMHLGETCSAHGRAISPRVDLSSLSCPPLHIVGEIHVFRQLRNRKHPRTRLFARVTVYISLGWRERLGAEGSEREPPV